MLPVRRFSSRYMAGALPASHRNEPSVSKRAVSTIPATPGTLKLPRLPVPALRKSLDGYLKSIQPLLLQDEVQNGVPFDAAYEKRVKLAEEFERGIGSILQERLIALDRKSPTNWLDDNFWMKKVYHEPRDPLLINSNWWLVFKDDPTIPEEARSMLPGNTTGISPWQVRRAASMVYRTLEFRDKLTDQTLYPETTRTGIWLNSATRKMFSVCRVPGHQSDSLSPEPESNSPYARQVVVLIHDYFYTIEVYDESWSRISPDRIEKLLFACVRDVGDRLNSTAEPATPIGLLTADDRGVWAENYSRLHAISPRNQKTLQKIHESLFCLSLDHFISPTALPPKEQRQIVTSNLKDHLHLVRSSYHARNRFFDKPYTLIVDPLARAGAMGEHSPVDALVPSIVGEYAIVEGICEDAFDVPPEEVASELGFPQGWQHLDWVLDEPIKAECSLAEERALAIINDSDDMVFCFDKYGGDWMKEIARLSPDAYIQMALQLAWYETRGSFTPTYETALTRLFQNGRTETIRTLTVDSCNWVRSMIDGKTSNVYRFGLLKRAVLSHNQLTRAAATGKGIDRHLLGLRMMIRRDQGEDADLFADELFQRTQTWKLSTSGLSAGHHFKGTGFGSGWKDGYGINYLAGPDMIKFGIESKHSCAETSTQEFSDAIERALDSMRAICVEGLDAKL